jgi:hypothetical protein
VKHITGHHPVDEKMKKTSNEPVSLLASHKLSPWESMKSHHEGQATNFNLWFKASQQ